ncbi:MAG TPA: SusD/RagB family nutrient-binding outer membrane lipoprotein, partial [Chitinophagaceae bacterium]|nr:SusD/RagB family nutrient-binding outer membrane lipoprotein [Chitinophagaceae bacterium]
AGALYDLQNIINTNTSTNMTAVARILKAYIYWTITDRWGDVPYTEALLGKTPKYDTQETIYKGNIAELAAAIAQFNTTSVISGDIIFGGDVAKWKKTANSLRMLMALRLSKRYPGAADYAATQFKAALADAAGSISSNADNFTLNFPGGSFKNSWWNVYDGRKDFGESATMTTLMGSLSDARQNAFGGATEDQSPSNPAWDDPSNVGVPYGWTRDKVDPWTQQNPTWARVLRGDLRQENDPLVMVGASQVLLARAEAADRGWTTENAATMLMNGVNASFEQWGIAPPAASYFTQAGVAFTVPTGTGGNLRQIATQRYIATYPNGLQGWSEWRRTGFPVLTPAPDAVNQSKQIPRRYTYGQGEYGTNANEVKAKAAAMPGGDTQDSRIWWDQ